MKTIRLLSSLVSIVAATSTVVALAGPASAQTRTVMDPRGDARPAIDITQVSLTNRDNVVQARIKVSDLRWRGHFYLTATPLDPENGSTVIDLHAKRDHTIGVSAAFESRSGYFDNQCSKGVYGRYAPEKHLVVVRIRRSCIRQVNFTKKLALEVESDIWAPGGNRQVSSDRLPQRFVKHS